MNDLEFKLSNIGTKCQSENSFIFSPIVFFFFSCCTDKMLMMLRWINEYCRSKSDDLSSADLYRYVLFIDDDYFLQLDSLLSYVDRIDNDAQITADQRRTFLTGHVYQRSRPRRFIYDRWYISTNDYPYDRYPPYVTAGCFLMTRSSARLFYFASKYNRLFRFDDIYIGLLAYSMSIQLISNNELFSSYGSYSNSLRGFFSKLMNFFIDEIDINSLNKSICIHGFREEKLIEIWKKIYPTNLTISISE